MSEQELKALRVRIDSLDEKILQLISDRARCAEEVARVKMPVWPKASNRCSIVPSERRRSSSA